jgi:hypothetical protein
MNSEPHVDLCAELSEDLKRVYAAYASLHLRPFPEEYKTRQAAILKQYIANGEAAIEAARKRE